MDENDEILKLNGILNVLLKIPFENWDEHPNGFCCKFNEQMIYLEVPGDKYDQTFYIEGLIIPNLEHLVSKYEMKLREYIKEKKNQDILKTLDRLYQKLVTQKA